MVIAVSQRAWRFARVVSGTPKSRLNRIDEMYQSVQSQCLDNAERLLRYLEGIFVRYVEGRYTRQQGRSRVASRPTAPRL